MQSESDVNRPSWSALVVDDDPGIRQSLRLCLEADGGRVLGVGTAVAALDALDRTAYDVVLLDLWLGTAESGLAVVAEILARQPGIGIIVITAFATYESAITAMKRGAADYLPKPFAPDQVRVAVRRLLDGRRVANRVVELEERIAGRDAGATFESRSAVYRSFLETARRAAASEAVLLLRGESGTGKNVFAQWLHARGPRSGGAFVTVNCPTLARDLVCSTLFGHRKGAVENAVSDMPGKVQEAEGGTLLLDEVAELNSEAQTRLLRFLNDQTYERIGETHERRADVRIIAVTSKVLGELVDAGRFRDDLFFRLNVLPLHIPLLRDRREDILPLAHHFLTFFERRQARSGLSFSDAATDALRNHAWPGNLRELRNTIERAVILTTAAILEPRDLGFVEAEGRCNDLQVGSLVSIDDLEREHIARVMSRTPTLEAAARVLGIDATTLGRKRKRYGLA